VPDRAWHAHLAEAETALKHQLEDGSHYLIRHGTMRAGLYVPGPADEQTPHTQDELYIILRGRGAFLKSGVRLSVCAGDVLSVEAGADHRFLDCTPDFATWVVFWGPDGGEGSGAVVHGAAHQLPTEAVAASARSGGRHG
jgi:mannose-6-phosphate isomerase-like protein (cupin superfamily)